MPFTYFSLFIIFIEYQLKKIETIFFLGSFLAMTMHYTSNLLGIKKKKNDPTIESGKIRIPFYKVGR
jgi:hypothetical protein